MKSHVFWILAILVVGGTFSNYYLTANFKNYAQGEKYAILNSEDFLIYVQLTGQLTDAFYRYFFYRFSLFWGLFIRRVGFKYTYILYMWDRYLSL